GRGNATRTASKQVALRNHTRALVSVGFIGRDVNRLLAQALDETAADRGVFNEKSARAVALLDFHDLPFERVKPKLAADHLKNVEDVLAPQQNHTSRVVT